MVVFIGNFARWGSLPVLWLANHSELRSFCFDVFHVDFKNKRPPCLLFLEYRVKKNLLLTRMVTTQLSQYPPFLPNPIP